MKLIEFAASLWASLWVWRAVMRLGDGDRSSLLIVYLVFYLEYVIPLSIDLISGIPDYSQQPGFSAASQDPCARLLYCVFVFLVPPLWFVNNSIHRRFQFKRSPQWVRTMLRVASFLPLYLLLAAPEPELYLTYGCIMLGNISLDVIMFHIVMSIGTMIAVFCAGSRCLIESFSRQTLIEVSAAVGVAIWLNGKRYIVAEALMLVILALWYRGVVTGRKLAWTVISGAIALCVFSVVYQSNMRRISFDPLSRDTTLENARIDYTRDSRVKMAIYSEIYPEKMRILEYRGQDLVYYATLLVPTTLWQDKPYSYASYFTSAMLNTYPQKIGWGMTTGVFDEAIADLGLLGILIGPLLVRWLCAAGDSVHGWNTHILTCLVVCLLMSVQLTAFMPLLLMWLISIITNKRAAILE